MLELALWPLWRVLKGPLKSLLQDKSSLVGGQLKALLSSTIDDLVAALQEVFFDTDTWRHYAKGTIERKGSDRYFTDRLLSVEVFPLAAIVSSSKIRDALAKRLHGNLRLDALRSDAHISDQDWKAIVEHYASDVVRHGLPFALGRMIKFGMPLYLSRYVIDVAQLEPLRIGGKAGHHTVVVLYDKPSFDQEATLARAAKIWKGRTKTSVNYVLADYDGFTAA